MKYASDHGQAGGRQHTKQKSEEKQYKDEKEMIRCGIYDNEKACNERQAHGQAKHQQDLLKAT